MGRAPCCDKANVKKGPWSPEEDVKLKSYIEQHGTGGNWIALPQKIGLKRCGKSCRLRWLNYLRPNIKHGGFSEEEDRIICSLHVSIGSRWSIIAAQLPGRTDNDVKNYWNTRLKKKLLGKPRKEHNPTGRRASGNPPRDVMKAVDECFREVTNDVQSPYWPQPVVMPTTICPRSADGDVNASIKKLLVNLGDNSHLYNNINNNIPVVLDMVASSSSSSSLAAILNSFIDVGGTGATFGDANILSTEVDEPLYGNEMRLEVENNIVDGKSGSGAGAGARCLEKLSWNDEVISPLFHQPPY